MKKKLMELATSNIAVGVLGGIAFWGFSKLNNKVVNDAYKVGFMDGVEAHQHAKEFADKLQEAIDKKKAED